VRALAAELDVPGGSRPEAREDGPVMHNTNVAKDNARVGQQVGAIHGDLHVEQRFGGKRA
jgi:adenosylhomocysteine nucleosidase